ncbi:MAG: TIGR02391 family protein [Sinimarinibacterium flocculans]|uniref:TIGR02391 family protein n=1 Tax=Sinimarinibacterium flocculans TaxID=985250 RepID=UPI003C47576E
MFGDIVAKYLPSADELLALEPEELAAFVLSLLSRPGMESRLNRYNFTLSDTVAAFPSHQQKDVSEALMAAWMWLEREGLLAPKPGDQGNWYFITRRGRQAATADGFAQYRAGELLPRRQLHGRIAQKVWATFIRGDYDTAVFQAFKEVEVRCREAGGFADTEIGTVLVRRAFDTSSGPLTNKSAPVAEREALQHLFAGAIGSYKNPHSHRNVKIDAGEAVEMIMLASHLLRIIDSRDPIERTA